MLIPLTIGLNSNNEAQQINLALVPLLILSYSHSRELQSYFSQIVIVDDHSIKAGRQFLIVNSRHSPSEDSSHKYFLTDDPEKGTHISRQALLNEVLKEMKLRNKIMRQKKITSFEKYHALNLWNSIKLKYSFLLIDDIWNLVSAKPQSLSISLFRIILNGPIVGIHTILGSNISYRNLLQQLIELNPAIEKMLQEKHGIPAPTQISAIAQELIISPDKLIFYKKSSVLDMQKYYPLFF